MASKSEYAVDEETINILKNGFIKDNVFFLTDNKLDREIYNKVDKVLNALGARWNSKLKGHSFEYDIKENLEKVCKEKKVMDWKKKTNFFYTPESIVNIMISLIPLWNDEKYKFLEPSCGQGHIADVLRKTFKNAEITCIEKNPNHCEILKNKGYNPICSDFLEIKPEEKYDVIFMNPPFSEEIEHIIHAYEFLNDDGYLLSVASLRILDKETKKSKEFKKWFDERCGHYRKLPEQSFKDSGTNIGTALLLFDKSCYLENLENLEN